MSSFPRSGTDSLLSRSTATQPALGGAADGAPAQGSGWRRWIWPLLSRKVQVAAATVLVAWAAQAGWMLSEETVATVLAVGVALIVGIAHEDAGRGRPLTISSAG
jgi:hypothetical protein